ncbi:toxin-antitoxin system YwqK family antitoxin [Ancylomarina sp. YFZ004]
MYKFLHFSLLCLFSLTLSAQNINKKDAQGRKQGYWENVTPLGKRVYAGNFKDDYPKGEMKRFHKNGAIKALLIFSNKGKNAKAQLYNTYGQLSATGNYIDKKKDSLWQYFDKNEQIRIQEFYVNGEKDGLSTYYYPNGQIYETYEYKQNNKHGQWLRYDRDGKKIICANYTNRRLDSFFTTYFKNGITKIDGSYKNGKRHGKWIFYTVKGEIEKTISYVMGVADNQSELDNIQKQELEAMEANKNKDIDPEHYIENPTEYLMKQRGK